MEVVKCTNCTKGMMDFRERVLLDSRTFFSLLVTSRISIAFDTKAY